VQRRERAARRIESSPRPLDVHRISPVVTLLLLTPSPAHAQPAAAPPSGEACAAAFEAGQARRQRGQLSVALRELETCAVATCPAAVANECTAWYEKVQAAMPSIQVAATDPQGVDTLAVRVLAGERVLAERLDTRAILLDPGEHRLRFELSGAQAVERTVVLREGEKQRRIEVRFVAQPTPELTPLPPADEGNEVERGPHPLAYAGVGIAAAGLVVGAVAGGIALQRARQLDERCLPMGAGCSQGDIDDGRIAAHVSTAGFAVLGAGAALTLIGLLLPVDVETSSNAGGWRLHF
jgi:hypothetical protein